MKKLYLLAVGLLAAGIVLSTACGTEEEGPLNLQWSVDQASEGMNLVLTWDAVEGADAYSVTVDGKLITDTITGTTFTVTAANAGKVITVAVVGGTTTDQADLSLVKSNVQVWSIADPDPNHPSGVHFDNDGNATAVSVSQAPEQVDFYVDGASATELALNSPNVGGYNNEKNYFSDPMTGNVADTAWAYYNYTEYIAGGNKYALWLGYGDGWDVNDHFVKVTVSSISNLQVGLTTAYQPEGGLRWLVE